MAINKRVDLTWGGKTYPILITMSIIERLEENLNLAKMAQDCATGNIKFSQAARLVSTLLNEAGATVTTEEVFSGMFDGGEVSGADVVLMVSSILGAVFPAPKKKPSTSSKPRKRRA